MLLFALLLAIGADAAVPAPSCKAFQGGPCCDREVSRRLSRYAVFSACRDTSERYLGERGSKDSCRYVFGPKRPKTKADKPDPADRTAPNGFVEILVSARDDVPEQPDDPFYAWSKVGNAFVAYKGKTPKAVDTLAASTGIWLPGQGQVVSVTASTKVCSRGEVQKLARSVH